jgi:1-acyl-sn-glycerol-3-phosphate acyltransferase
LKPYPDPKLPFQPESSAGQFTNLESTPDPTPPPNPIPGWSLTFRDPQAIRAWMPFWGWFYDHYFRVQTSGWEQIPADPVLFVGSHNGGLASPDMVMTMYDWFRRYGVERPIYGLMHPQVWRVYEPLARLAAQVGALQAHPKMAIAALQQRSSVLVYPGGAQDVFRPHAQRHRIHLAGRHGFIKLALQQNVPIVPVVSTGAHDTLFVLADFYPQAKQLNAWGMPWILGLDPQVFPIYLGLPWGLSIGPLPNLPLPAQIHTRVCKPIVFERYGAEAASDRPYVHACYQRVEREMQQALDTLVAETDK